MMTPRVNEIIVKATEESNFLQPLSNEVIRRSFKNFASSYTPKRRPLSMTDFDLSITKPLTVSNVGRPVH